MITPKDYYILAFDTTTSVMAAEARLKEHFSISIMPVPREISKGCGLAIRFQEPVEAAIMDFLSNASLDCTLYKMNTKKIDGKHPIEEIPVKPAATRDTPQVQTDGSEYTAQIKV